MVKKTPLERMIESDVFPCDTNIDTVVVADDGGDWKNHSKALGQIKLRNIC